MSIIEIFRIFTIRVRMVASIAIVVLLLSAVGSSGLWGMFRIQLSGTSFIEGPFSDAVHLGELFQHFGDARREEKSMIILFKQDIVQRKEQWTQAISRSEMDIKSLRDSATDPQTIKLIQELDKQLGDYKKSFEAKVNNFAFYSDSSAVEQDLAFLQRSADDAQSLMVLLQKRLQENSDHVRQGLDSSSKRTLVFFCCILVGSMVIVISFTVANLRSIVKPIDEAKRIAISIANGNLMASADRSGRDECADLIGALSDMQTSLRATVSGVRHSTLNISVASSEVALGSQDLSIRTERSATSIQDTANALQQVTNTVHTSSQSARMASDLATSASEVAERGGEVVSLVVSTMADIRDSSKHIAEITNLIDAISFQTNILALNAAVEAARAGDQGRGFAVVASEVRALAKRSAQAAREIRELIDTSVNKIESGSSLVNKAGSTMSEVVVSIRRASMMIGEVSAASTEQSGRLVEVNTSVAQLEAITQQNAALVEQSAAAADSLKEQAEMLSQLMQYFRYTDSAEEPSNFQGLTVLS